MRAGRVLLRAPDARVLDAPDGVSNMNALAFCNACGSRSLARVGGTAYGVRCGACGYGAVHKPTDPADVKVLERLGVTL